MHAGAGQVVPSTDADHIVRLEDGGGWSLSNGQGLCASCHGRKTAGETRAKPRESDVTGWGVGG